MFLLLSAALAGPAMITASKGAVSLEGSDAPPAPFLLNEGQALKIAEGATVVVLYEGAATQIKGPATLSVGDLTGAKAADGDELALLGDLMTRTTSVGSVGATRAVGGLSLERPLAGSVVVQPSEIRWSCTACGEQQVEIISFLDDEVVWTGKGTGHVAYDGPALQPGPYAVTVGGNEFAFKVAKTADVKQVETAIEAARGAVEGLELAAATSVISAVYLQANMPNEALRIVDEAVASEPDNEDLKALQGSLEKRLGLTE